MRENLTGSEGGGPQGEPQPQIQPMSQPQEREANNHFVDVASDFAHQAQDAAHQSRSIPKGDRQTVQEVVTGILNELVFAAQT